MLEQAKSFLGACQGPPYNGGGGHRRPYEAEVEGGEEVGEEVVEEMVWGEMTAG